MATDKEVVSKDTLRLLVDGKLSWEEAKKLLRLQPKDPDRFEKYLEVLQERVPWKEKILLRIHDHLYIVRKRPGERIVKCDCGHEFGDYRVNWKLSCVVRVRRTKEEIQEVYPLEELSPDPDWVSIREYYCPGCMALLSVEVAPTGIPTLFDWLPNLDAFYREWLGKPLEDEDKGWFEDRTAQLTSQWANEAAKKKGG